MRTLQPVKLRVGLQTHAVRFTACFEVAESKFCKPSIAATCRLRHSYSVSDEQERWVLVFLTLLWGGATLNVIPLGGPWDGLDFAIVDGESFSPSCSTLVQPALSIGNVGQLAVDLMVSSARARRVAYLDEPSVLPCAGNDAFGPDAVGDLALALEAYESPSHRLAFIQQRSPVITGMVVSFAKNVANFISTIGKDHVVIISSLDSGKRRVIGASSDMQLYYLSSCNEDGSDPEYEKLGWKKLEEYGPSQRRWKCLSSLVEGGDLSEDMAGDPDEMTISDYYASLPFAALFSACKAKGLKVTCVLCYCSEGDNMPESFQLAKAVCKLLGQGPEQFHGNGSNGWIIPLSWKSVYGPPPDMSIF